MIILALDPGIAAAGYGVVEKRGQELRALDFGVISTPAGESTPARLRTIYQELLCLIDRHSPDVFATERLFFARNEATAFAVGRVIGVALLAAAERNLDWAEYTPASVKQAVVGYGAADKKQVQYMIQRLLGLAGPPKPDDAADALAVAICHAHSMPSPALAASTQ